MTNQQHPITPPPELVREWWAQETYDPFGVAVSNLATQAARWGADQELEACVKWIEDCGYHPSVPEDLRAARRPKPPSLAEQALAKTEAILNDPNRALLTEVREALELNRRALERLQGLEKGNE